MKRVMALLEFETDESSSFFRNHDKERAIEIRDGNDLLFCRLLPGGLSRCDIWTFFEFL
jgi:hypothetical protein